MDKQIKAAVAEVVEHLVKTQAKKATKFLNAKLVVSAARRIYGGKISRRDNIDIVLKIGKPNYQEREHIAKWNKEENQLPPRLLRFGR